MLPRKPGWLCLALIIGVVNGPAGQLDSAFSQERVQGNWSLNQPAAVNLPETTRVDSGAARAISGQTGTTAALQFASPASSAPDTLSRPLPLPASSSPENPVGELGVVPSVAESESPQQGGQSREPTVSPPSDPFLSGLAQGAEALGATRLSGSFIQTALLVGALGLAPAILLMTTCYIRIMVVLGLLRQALGTTQLPPTQILMSLSMFLTILVMTPVWLEIKTKAYDPWSREKNPISWEEAWSAGTVPLKQFMVRQIEICGNRSAVEVLYRHGKVGSAAVPPQNLNEAPLNIVLPAFILSELKVAFLLGFQIFLPFLILDLVVSTVTVSMGLAMLPPTMVSLPLKLILFVLVDGWNLVVGMLLQSFGGS
jgi:flagellar biosynthetic protein FliP